MRLLVAYEWYTMNMYLELWGPAQKDLVHGPIWSDPVDGFLELYKGILGLYVHSFSFCFYNRAVK